MRKRTGRPPDSAWTTAFSTPQSKNAQQAVEKALKALCLFKGMPVKKTHRISGLPCDLLQSGVDCALDDEDCEWS
jgi:HEPN domain-containing protein